VVMFFPWGQPTDEAKILPYPCGGSALHGSEVYLTGVGTQSGPAFEGFLVIKRRKKKRRGNIMVLDMVCVLMLISYLLVNVDLIRPLVCMHLFCMFIPVPFCMPL
jgi:hypothetical protein